MSVNTDPRPLMIQIAKMANMDLAYIRRMVLVLDVDDIPRLYVESFMDSREGELPHVKLETLNEPYYVDTTTIKNERMKTKLPLQPPGVD